jgi:hypothetical protein
MGTRFTLTLTLDDEVRQRAEALLAVDGRTMAELVQDVLTGFAAGAEWDEGPVEKEDGYDEWFLAQVDEALNSTEPTIPHDQMVSHMRDLMDRRDRGEA